jgi:ParB-like chromosome segregation protein Spo0J
MTTPPILSEKLEIVPVGELKTHPKNPKKGDTKAIRASIEANGFYGSIVAQRSTGYILVGNHRWAAAKQAGLSTVPVLFVDVDDKTARRILAADNRTSDLGTYDDEALAKLLEELRNEGALKGSGYDADDLDKLIEKIGDDVLDAEPQMDGLEYKVIVECASEEEQSMLLQKLEADGLSCRPVIS